MSLEEKRDMIYGGHIASDDDLIKASTCEGLISRNSLQFGKDEFNFVTPGRLTITASEHECGALLDQF